jgi:predicted nucleic acid-binding protein
MAGSARYTALLDANVLYPAPLRDLLLSLAAVGLYHARWTDRIQQEWVRNLEANRPELAGKFVQTVQLMNTAIPDCLVENYEHLIDSLQLPDPDDRHVLAAAIAGHADAIITLNLKDFPAQALEPHNIEAQHPDEFALNQLDLSEAVALHAIRTMRSRLKAPPRTAMELLETFERIGLPMTAARLRQTIRLI